MAGLALVVVFVLVLAETEFAGLFLGFFVQRFDFEGGVCFGICGELSLLSAEDGDCDVPVLDHFEGAFVCQSGAGWDGEKDRGVLFVGATFAEDFFEFSEF